MTAIATLSTPIATVAKQRDTEERSSHELGKKVAPIVSTDGPLALDVWAQSLPMDRQVKNRAPRAGRS